MTKTILIAGFCLVLGLIVGFFVGRVMLVRQWSQPLVQISPEDASKSSEGNADPTPKAGAKVMKPMPIGRTRAALRTLTDRDPVVSTVAAVGAGDNGSIELNVTLENRGRCTVTHAEGVAYGFDAYGQPAKLNKAGESYVAFTLDEPLEPGKHRITSEDLHHVDLATLALAQVDKTTCSDGSTWARQ